MGTMKNRNKKIEFHIFLTSIVITLIATIIFIWRLNFAPLYDNSMASMSIELISLFLINAFIGGCVADHPMDEEFNKLFCVFLHVIDLSWLSDICVWAFDDFNAQIFVNLNILSNTISIFLNFFVVLRFGVYLFYVFPVKKKWHESFLKVIKCYGLLIIAALIINLSFPFIFKIVYGHYVELVGENVCTYINEIIMIIILIAAASQPMDGVEKIAVLIYLGLPVIGMFMQMNLRGFAFYQASMSLSTSILYVNGHLRQSSLLQQQKVQLTEQHSAIMLSQIQPHFMYNTLTSIASLCGTDPDTAEQLTLKFSKYMRDNMNALSSNHTVPLTDELAHVRTYVDIEKVRFGDGLEVEYNINETSFNVPALAIQPLVENAIKHGIRKKEDGGMVKISTYSDGADWIVSITDNGVGFNPDDPSLNDGTHIGINNVRDRLRVMCNGSLEIDSMPGYGASALVRIPKESRL